MRYLELIFILLRTIVIVSGAVVFPVWVDLKLRAIVKRNASASEVNLFSDIFKLFRKETLVSGDVPWIFFLIVPGLTFIFSLLLLLLSFDMFAWRPIFSVDVITLVIVLLLPFFMQILSASISHNPRSIIQASHLYKMMAYLSVPLIISMFQPVVHHAGSFKMGSILAGQIISGTTLFSLSGFLSFTIFVFAANSLLRMFPRLRDNMVSENIVSMEYSGPLLAFVILSSWILRASFSLIALGMYCWRTPSNFIVFLKYLSIIVVFWLISLIMDLYPPEKTKIYFKILAVLSVIVLILMALGL